MNKTVIGNKKDISGSENEANIFVKNVPFKIKWTSHFHESFGLIISSLTDIDTIWTLYMLLILHTKTYYVGHFMLPNILKMHTLEQLPCPINIESIQYTKCTDFYLLELDNEHISLFTQLSFPVTRLSVLSLKLWIRNSNI